MFTGIIEAKGSIARMTPKGGDMTLHIRTGDLDLADVQLGDSIATNGVCLTVISLPGDGSVSYTHLPSPRDLSTSRMPSSA